MTRVSTDADGTNEGLTLISIHEFEGLIIHTVSRADPELYAVQLTFLNCEDVKPSACIFINGQYLVEKPLIY